MPDTEQARSAATLDKALEDTFPASDPPSQTSPAVATPSTDSLRTPDAHGELRIHRVIEPREASQPFAPNDTGGRWSPPGAPCVYASLSPAAAMLEYLAHLEGRTPEELVLAVAQIPAASVLAEVNPPSTWSELPYRAEVRAVGKAWLDSGRSLALRVPSALCPDECNVLLNPGHEDYAGLELLALRPIRIDERVRT